MVWVQPPLSPLLTLYPFLPHSTCGLWLCRELGSARKNDSSGGFLIQYLLPAFPLQGSPTSWQQTLKEGTTSASVLSWCRHGGSPRVIPVLLQPQAAGNCCLGELDLAETVAAVLGLPLPVPAPLASRGNPREGVQDGSRCWKQEFIHCHHYPWLSPSSYIATPHSSWMEQDSVSSGQQKARPLSLCTCSLPGLLVSSAGLGTETVLHPIFPWSEGLCATLLFRKSWIHPCSQMSVLTTRIK